MEIHLPGSVSVELFFCSLYFFQLNIFNPNASISGRGISSLPIPRHVGQHQRHQLNNDTSPFSLAQFLSNSLQEPRKNRHNGLTQSLPSHFQLRANPRRYRLIRIPLLRCSSPHRQFPNQRRVFITTRTDRALSGGDSPHCLRFPRRLVLGRIL